jgi:hypothetical protein
VKSQEQEWGDCWDGGVGAAVGDSVPGICCNAGVDAAVGDGVGG